MTLINATSHSITLVSRRGVEQDSKKQFQRETVEILEEIRRGFSHEFQWSTPLQGGLMVFLLNL
ncbi:MAG: hypothetical protein IM506_18680 [Microcystis sp. M19BS1]|uniref:hypothetical protein n=1 Tax=Microcystis sp. M19BS1 TaxID=2771180 RepID=UPI00258C414E|nr:hypothetical protein [Microcystis sp. M19BS1]MCA2625725.1 hypothetical protein [Microcystis sp. M19BS1]